MTRRATYRDGMAAEAMLRRDRRAKLTLAELNVHNISDALLGEWLGNADPAIRAIAAAEDERRHELYINPQGLM